MTKSQLIVSDDVARARNFILAMRRVSTQHLVRIENHMLGLDEASASDDKFKSQVSNMMTIMTSATIKSAERQFGEKVTRQALMQLRKSYDHIKNDRNIADYLGMTMES